MKNNRKILIALLTLVVGILLAACEGSSAESSDASDNQSQINNSSQSTNDDSSNGDSTERISKTDKSNTDKNNANKTEDTTDNVPAENDPPATNTEVSLKETYLKKLNDTKKELEKIEASDPSTYAMKKVESDRYDVLDGLLNEIYGVLKEQLPPEEMDQLREEQRNWIEYRDDSALEASLKYKGGTQEHLEYVIVLANLTEERCFELVKNYM